MSLKHLACASTLALALFTATAPSRADIPPPDTMGGDTTQADTALPTDTAAPVDTSEATDTATPTDTTTATDAVSNDTAGTTSEGGGGCATTSATSLGLAFGFAALLRLRKPNASTES